MVHGYNTLTDQAKREMLEEIGVASVEDLFQSIPNKLRLSQGIDIPPALTEWEIENEMRRLSSKNLSAVSTKCFLGGGFYDHYVPKIIDAIVTRGEFLTSYTPYQPEMSQGLLQVLYEYQILTSKLTGHSVVNSSCYDGGTAIADATWMTCLINGTKPNVVLVQETLWSQYMEIIETYMDARDVEIVKIPFQVESGQINLSALQTLIEGHNPSGIVLQCPNALGIIEQIGQIAHIAKQYGIITALSYNPLLSGALEVPGRLGIDIVTSEGQSLGLPLNAGGPSLGIFSTREIYRNFVPGRIVGRVTDINGNLAFSLVHEDREQHVAREKATSNICSNQALNAIRVAIFLSYMGEVGIRYVSVANFSKGKKFRNALSKISGVKIPFSGPHFNEFVIQLSKPVEKVIEKMLAKNIFSGVRLDEKFGLTNALLVAITEKYNDQDIDFYISALEEVLSE